MGMSILLVEDHNRTRTVLARILEHCGYEVIQAGNYHAALELLANSKFDILIADIGLPDGDGMDLVVEAKRLQPLKAIAVTAWTSRADHERGLQAGFDTYLDKPVNIDRLKQALATAKPANCHSGSTQDKSCAVQGDSG